MTTTRNKLNGLLVALAAATLLCLGVVLGVGADRANAKSAIYEYSSHPTIAQAGMHPDVISKFELGTRYNQGPMPPCLCNDPKDVILRLPQGVIANPHVAAICTAAEAAVFGCSADSQVGIIVLKLLNILYTTLPIYRTTPQDDQAGVFLFLSPIGGAAPIYMTFNARTESDFGLNVETIGINHAISFDYVAPIIWGIPADPSHDQLRFQPPERRIDCLSDPIAELEKGQMGGGCFMTPYPEIGQQLEKPKVPSTLPIKPMIQAPSTCIGPLTSSLETLSYDRGTDFAMQPWPETTGCDQLSFDPSLSANPTTTATDSASGVDVKLTVPQPQDATTPSPSPLKASTVSLPEGFSINPNAADGKTACSDTEAKLGTRLPAACPEFSKVGTLVLDSSALPAPIPGFIYLGEPKPGDPYRLILAVDGFGTAIKVTGSIRPNPQTGQMVVAFDELPEAPFQLFDMHFFGSERGLLATPPKCGKFPVKSTFQPWSTETSDQSSEQFFVLDSSPGGASCPGGTRPFAPSLEAGSEDNTAGRYSPFTVRVNRPDGNQNLSAIDVKTPPGFLASLRGIPYCPESAIATLADTGHTGLAEMAAPACPAASQVGTTVTTEGAGAKPLFTPGKVYLAGPYKGAPLSLVITVPAVSGPYDLGNVAVRVAIHVDPVTAQITAVSDPLPSILEGIPLRIRSVLVKLNRAGFTLNPTDCSTFAVDATGHGSEGATSTSSARFQVANCLDLDFQPKLSLQLKGKSRRGAHPALHSTLRMKPGETNLNRVVVTMPKTVLLDSQHLRNVCSRVLFAANACPPETVYGHARAETPLLDQPLEGPVYLRSSDRRLPDLVAKLDGQIDIEVSAHISSVKGGLRATFAGIPDAPISKFTLDLQGGAKGVLENSDGVCSKKSRAKVRMVGQNNVRDDRRTRLRAACGKATHRAARKHHG